jgi:hypothetical protein
MLPAPTRIAATPSTRIQVPWNPAVPPPPVAGAAVGGGTVGLAVVGVGVGMVGVGVGVLVALSVAVGVTVGVGVTVDVAVAVPEGDDVGSVIDEVPPVVQAEITAEASMAEMPQPSAASLALSPVLAVVVRPLMETPRKRRGP